ncbi:MAG TPA: undecaprenyl-diphosphate phosphatase [Bacteroidia bacterium]|jgi:undecaprenyl-diphosphatase|nr:undecaprenyl-diphosphate phosphatase [Bacteroidia bacterium]
MSYLEAIILAIVEGLTEFLPVSSTGHMIITSGILGIRSTEFVKLFTVCIQLGAIAAVVIMYFKRFFQSVNFYLKLFVAFIPAAIFGVLLGDYIDSLLENPLGVGIALLLGGVIFLFIDKWFTKEEVQSSDDVNFMQAFKIGLFQCIALFPGVSRSGATIVGGLSQKLSRKAAAEFSFFLAVPTMFAATAKKLYDFYKHSGMPTSEEIKILAVGNIVAFVVALMAIRFFINILTRYGFKIFGWYRILAGGIIILLYILGIELNVL